jgi:hypothetical protein
MHRSFGIVPPLSWLAHHFADAGFSIADLYEVGPDDYFQNVDTRAYCFAREFPVWQLLELKANNS